MAAELGARVIASRRFRLDPAREVEGLAGGGDELGHGTALARVIIAGAPQARLLDARIFEATMATSAAVAAAGGAILLGAHPRPSQGFEGEGPGGGASFAVAHVCALLAAFLGPHGQAGGAAARHHLEAIARYHGPERRSSADG